MPIRGSHSLAHLAGSPGGTACSVFRAEPRFPTSPVLPARDFPGMHLTLVRNFFAPITVVQPAWSPVSERSRRNRTHAPTLMPAVGW